VVGVAMAGFQLYDSYKSEDTAALIGNSFNLLGSIFLLSSASLFVLVGFIAVVVGAVIKTLAFDEFEKWIEQGYWGGSDTYWGVARGSIDKQKLDFRSYMIDKNTINVDLHSLMNKEKLWFYDLISKPEIKIENTNNIKLYCASIYQESEVGNVSATIEYYSYSPSGGYFLTNSRIIDSDSFSLIEPGVVSITVIKNENIRKRVRATIMRVQKDESDKVEVMGEFNVESDFF